MDDTGRMQDWHDREDRLFAEYCEQEAAAMGYEYNRCADALIDLMPDEYPSKLARDIVAEIMHEEGWR